MKINTDFISKNNTYEGNTPKYIVVHNTDNFAEGADAHAHVLAQYRKNFRICPHTITWMIKKLFIRLQIYAEVVGM